jgi:hypothetical protein
MLSLCKSLIENAGGKEKDIMLTIFDREFRREK